jgi:hypothetical protein
MRSTKLKTFMKWFIYEIMKYFYFRRYNKGRSSMWIRSNERAMYNALYMCRVHKLQGKRYILLEAVVNIAIQYAISALKDHPLSAINSGADLAYTWRLPAKKTRRRESERATLARSPSLSSRSDQGVGHVCMQCHPAQPVWQLELADQS